MEIKHSLVPTIDITYISSTRTYKHNVAIIIITQFIKFTYIVSLTHSRNSLTGVFNSLTTNHFNVNSISNPLPGHRLLTTQAIQHVRHRTQIQISYPMCQTSQSSIVDITHKSKLAIQYIGHRSQIDLVTQYVSHRSTTGFPKEIIISVCLCNCTRVYILYHVITIHNIAQAPQANHHNKQYYILQLEKCTHQKSILKYLSARVFK